MLSPARGAISILLLCLASLSTCGSVLLDEYVSIISSDARAETAADAAAHATIVAAMQNPNREKINVAAQAGNDPCAADTVVNDSDLARVCTDLRTAADTIAQKNGARILSFTLGADVRHLEDPHQLVVLLSTTVERQSPLHTLLCQNSNKVKTVTRDLCHAVAWSSAAETT